MTVNDDRVVIQPGTSSNGLAFARTNYYTNRLNGLEGFDGFFPRLFIPNSRIYKKNEDTDEYSFATQTLFWIDSTNEIKVGVGLDFPPVLLGAGDIQVNEDIANQLNLSVGDKVSYLVNATALKDKIPALDKTMAFALLSTQIEGMYMDFDREQVLLEDHMVPFSNLGLRSPKSADSNDDIS